MLICLTANLRSWYKLPCHEVTRLNIHRTLLLTIDKFFSELVTGDLKNIQALCYL